MYMIMLIITHLQKKNFNVGGEEKIMSVKLNKTFKYTMSEFLVDTEQVFLYTRNREKLYKWFLRINHKGFSYSILKAVSKQAYKNLGYHYPEVYVETVIKPVVTRNILLK